MTSEISITYMINLSDDPERNHFHKRIESLMGKSIRYVKTLQSGGFPWHFRLSQTSPRFTGYLSTTSIINYSICEVCYNNPPKLDYIYICSFGKLRKL